MTTITMQPVQMSFQVSTNNNTNGADEVVQAVEPQDGTRLSVASVELDGAADVRWEKVQSLRAQIAAGTYRIPSSEIAGRMMDEMIG